MFSESTFNLILEVSLKMVPVDPRVVKHCLIAQEVTSSVLHSFWFYSMLSAFRSLFESVRHTLHTFSVFLAAQRIIVERWNQPKKEAENFLNVDFIKFQFFYIYVLCTFFPGTAVRQHLLYFWLIRVKRNYEKSFFVGSKLKCHPLSYKCFSQLKWF